MIIVEGPDCVGKTTLAQALRTELKIPYIHFSVLSPTWNYESDYEAYMPVKGVCDRFFHSEIAYGLGVRSFTHIDPPKWKRLVDKTRQTCLVIGILPEWTVIESRWNQSREMFSLDEVRKVYSIYHDMFFGNNYIYDARPDIRISSSKPTDFLGQIHAIYRERILKA